MKKHLITLIALASAAACLAQNTITRPADSTSGTARAVVGFTGGVSEARVSQIISSSGGGGGATLLPYDLPAGSWRNAASYPLEVRTNYAPGWHIITIGGRTVSAAGSGDNHPSTSATIPPGAAFTTNQPSVVTAMANGATWQATNILFNVASSNTIIGRNEYYVGYAYGSRYPQWVYYDIYDTYRATSTNNWGQTSTNTSTTYVAREMRCASGWEEICWPPQY
jgi:hypothetical protein